MKTVSLADYEFEQLLIELRERLRSEEFQRDMNPNQEWHGYHAHCCRHLLEAINPKHPKPQWQAAKPIKKISEQSVLEATA